MKREKIIVYATLASIIALLTGVKSHTSPSGGCSPHWTESAPFPEPTSDYAAGVLDGRLVIAGGDYWEGSNDHWIKKLFSSKVWAFNSITQVWDKLPNLPEPLAGAGSVVIGNRLFVLGGYTGQRVSRKVYTLERSSRGYVWKYFSSLPFDRVYAAAVAVGTRVYILGGLTQFEPQDPTGTCCNSTTATNSFMVLDTAHPDKGWHQLAPVPGPRRWFFNAVASEKAIWIFGGRFQIRTEGPIENFSKLVFRYDITGARWEPMKPLPEESPTADPPSPVLVKGKIVLITNRKIGWELNPLTSKYTMLPSFPKAVLVDKFVCLDDRIVGAGGESMPPGPRRRSNSTFIGRCSQMP